MNKKGVSPVIATVLLILLVIIIAAIIILWARNFLGEKVQKTIGKEPEAIELVCERVTFSADVALSGTLTVSVSNTGNVPIYGIELRKKSLFGVKKIGSNGEGIFANSIVSGEDNTADITNNNVAAGDKLVVVPILLGDGNKAYVCSDQYGVEIVVG